MAELSSQALDGAVETYTVKHIQEWFVQMLSELLELKPEEVKLDQSFDRFGLDSSAAIGLTESLGAMLGCEFGPTLLYDHPTINAVGQHLLDTGKIGK